MLDSGKSYDADEEDFVLRTRRRSRSPAVTIFLGLMIVGYSFAVSVNVTALVNPKSGAKLAELYHFPVWVVPAVTVCAALNVFWAMALLQWKKWGFYGFLASSLAMCVIPLLGGGIQRLAAAWQAGTMLSGEAIEQLLNAGASIAAVLILFVLLRVGGPRSTWNQLD